MSFRSRLLAFVALYALMHASAVRAQDPAPETSAWVQTASVGLAFTSGNKDTSTLNLGYNLVYDANSRNLVKVDGLFFRGTTEGEVTADRLALVVRDEFRLQERLFTFGELQYLRDRFKTIDYLVSPAVGIGYRLADSDRTRLSIGAGIGTVSDKRPLFDVRSSGAVTLDQKLSHQLSQTAVLTQSLTALYSTRRFDDALYTFSSALAASVTARTQLKVELLDTYKPAVAASFNSNDVALIVGMVFKR